VVVTGNSAVYDTAILYLHNNIFLTDIIDYGEGGGEVGTG